MNKVEKIKLKNGQNSIDFLSKLIPTVTYTIVLTGVSVVKAFFNLVVAIIVSCYLLIDKKK